MTIKEMLSTYLSIYLIYHPQRPRRRTSCRRLPIPSRLLRAEEEDDDEDTEKQQEEEVKRDKLRQPRNYREYTTNLFVNVDAVNLGAKNVAKTNIIHRRTISFEANRLHRV